MNLVFNVLQGTFQRVAATSQRVALASAAFCATRSDVLRKQSVAQSVAQKFQPTQWDGGRCNTATLLSLYIKIITYVYTHTRTYACTYRGNNRGVFEVLRGPVPGVVS